VRQVLAARRVERIGYAIGAALLLSGFVHVAILLISGDSWEGPTSLRKAATFGLSFGITLLSVVWVSTFVPLAERTRIWLLGIFSGACVLETMLVSLQAWRGVPSHFNVETPFDAFVAPLLAFGGFTLVVTITTLMCASFRTDTAVPVSLRVAIRVGFVALFGAQVIFLRTADVVRADRAVAATSQFRGVGAFPRRNRFLDGLGRDSRIDHCVPSARADRAADARWRPSISSSCTPGRPPRHSRSGGSSTPSIKGDNRFLGLLRS
jgi:hypothetical protein